jgi:isopenicillin N synthase-like dioxygenase
MTEIPVIDVSDLRSGALTQRRAVAEKLGAACRDVGFFYVTGHNFPAALVGQAFDAARTFFALPVSDKQRLSIKHSPHNRGYVEMQGERLQQNAPPDRKEAFNIGLDLAAQHPDVLAGKPFRGINVWPPIAGWREQLLAYYEACWSLGRRIHRGFALDLGLPEDFFDDKLDAPMATLRLLHYPAPAGDKLPDQPGAGEHTDYGNITILATDGVAGLEVRARDGGWLDAPHIPGALICNIGDCLMRWTNDVYVSTPHRVRIPDRERFSIAFFLDPNPDAIVATLPGFADARGQSKYPAITGAEYLTARLNATYDHRQAKNA